MDERPFRSRPSSRPARSSERPTVAEKPVHSSDPEIARETETPKPKTTSTSRANKQKSKLPIWSIVVATIVVIGVTIWLIMSMQTGGSNGLIDSSKYQAVFSTNGQVYFGNLKDTGSDYMKLSSAYYLQSQTAKTDDESIAQNDSKLIKLGNEIYGPEDTMMISKKQILYFENLKSDSKVSKLIDQYEASH